MTQRNKGGAVTELVPIQHCLRWEWSHQACELHVGCSEVDIPPDVGAAHLGQVWAGQFNLGDTLTGLASSVLGQMKSGGVWRRKEEEAPDRAQGSISCFVVIWGSFYCCLFCFEWTRSREGG
jgi:hypothetical protein